MSSPEVDDDGDQRAEMQRDVERLVEGVVLLQVLPVPQPGHEDQVARRGDRQQFRRTLDEAEHERLPVRQRPGLIPHSEERQHDREGETGARGDPEGPAAHRRRPYGPSRAPDAANQNFFAICRKHASPRPCPDRTPPLGCLHAESTERD